MKKIILLLLFPLSMLGQKDYSSLLKQFMTGQHDYFRFNGNTLIAQRRTYYIPAGAGICRFQFKKAFERQLGF